MSTIDEKKIKRILIMKMRGIGDVVLATPVITNLKAHFPDAQIDFFTETFAADVVRNHTGISNVITFNRKKDSSLALINRVRKGSYDLIFDLYGNPRTAILTVFSGARYRVGFPFRVRRYAYNILVPSRGSEVHNVEFNLDALRFIGIPIQSNTPTIVLSDKHLHWARQWLSLNNINNELIIGFNPSGGTFARQWGLDHFAALGDLIAEHYKAKILLLWGPGEENDVEYIKRKMKSESFIIPRTELNQLFAIIAQCQYFVSNNAGPMHIAAALGVPTLGIHGPTNPHHQGPYGPQHVWVRKEDLDCLGCNLTSCPIGNICMTELGPEKVFSALTELVKKNTR